MSKILFALFMSMCVSAAAARVDETELALPLNVPHAGWPELRLVAHVFPPFQFKRNGNMVGPFMKIMSLVCDKAQVNCSVHMHAFKDAYADALDGDVDIIFSFLLEGDAERDKLFMLSPSIVSTSYSFFVSSTSKWTYKGSPKDLEGRTIGVYGPSGTSIIAKRIVETNSSAKLVVEDTTLKVFQQLVVGTYGERAAVVSNKDVGLSLLKNANIYGPKVAGDITPATFGFGFSRASKNLRYANPMFEAVTALKKNGIISSILTNNEDPLVPSP